MKSMCFAFFILLLAHSATAQLVENAPSTFPQANILSIDDLDYNPNYVEVSEEGLPKDHYQQLLQQIPIFKFTLLTEKQVRDFFDTLKVNSRARNRYAGGGCAQRRYYIQSLLKKNNLTTGRLLINCPANNGRLRLKDRASGHTYTFSNFHDVNILAIKGESGNEFRVMDVQFEDGPASLHDYLTEIEANQKIRPAKRRDASARGRCYWTVSTQYLSY